MLEWTFETPAQVGMYLKKYLPTMKTVETLIFVRKVEDSKGSRLEWSHNGDDWTNLQKEDDCVWCGPLEIKNSLIDYDSIVVKYNRSYLTLNYSRVFIVRTNADRFIGDNSIEYGANGIPLDYTFLEHRLIKEIKNDK